MNKKNKVKLKRIIKNFEKFLTDMFMLIALVSGVITLIFSGIFIMALALVDGSDLIIYMIFPIISALASIEYFYVYMLLKKECKNE